MTKDKIQRWFEANWGRQVLLVLGLLVVAITFDTLILIAVDRLTP